MSANGGFIAPSCTKSRFSEPLDSARTRTTDYKMVSVSLLFFSLCGVKPAHARSPPPLSRSRGGRGGFIHRRAHGQIAYSKLFDPQLHRAIFPFYSIRRGRRLLDAVGEERTGRTFPRALLSKLGKIGLSTIRQFGAFGQHLLGAFISAPP